MRALLTKINETLKPYYELIGMIIFFVGSIYGIYKWVVKPSDLSVTIEKKEIYYPNSVNSTLLRLTSYLTDSCHNYQALVDVDGLRKYLISTNAFWSIKIKNKSKTTLENIRLRVTNVTELSSYAVSSQYFLDNEKDQILKKISYQETDGIVYLEKIDELPPNAEITFYIWGKIPTLLIDENVFIMYKDGSAQLEKETTVSGLKAYLVEYIYEMFFIVLLLFSIIYVRALKRRP